MWRKRSHQGCEAGVMKGQACHYGVHRWVAGQAGVRARGRAANKLNVRRAGQGAAELTGCAHDAGDVTSARIGWRTR